MSYQRHANNSVTVPLSQLELELMGSHGRLSYSGNPCLKHLLSFHAVPLVCQLHLSEVLLIKSLMISHSSSFNNHRSSSVPLIQSQTWQKVRLESRFLHGN